MPRFALLLAFALIAAPAQAGDPDKPHHHRGFFPAITEDPGRLRLSAEEEAKLASGELVQQQIQAEDSGWGAAAMLIAAPPEVIWDTILDYDRYVERVKAVKACSVYRREGDRLWVDMQSGVPGFTYSVYSVNVVRRDEGWMAWHLDYDRLSDVYDLVGHWRVEQVQQSPPVSRLEHSTRMKVRGVPKFILDALTKSALEDGTAWVKKYSEAAAR